MESNVTKLWDEPEIFRIRVDLPDNPLKNLNVYVIRCGKQSLIIDTGFCRDSCRRQLFGGLEEIRLDLRKSKLFLTHFHSDHTGLVWDFIEKGVPVYMGETDYQCCLAMWADGDAAVFQLFRREGFPDSQAALQRSGNQGIVYGPRNGYPVTTVKDREFLFVGDLPVQAIRTPGHTPGHMVLYLPEQQLLFSGDHVLFDITPNISAWPHMRDPLGDYLQNLEKIKKLPVCRAFPAHRDAGEDLAKRIDEIMLHHRQRLYEICGAVAAHPGLTAYDLAGHIGWSAHGLSWEEFPPHQRWFAAGECIAHLYHLYEEGRIRKECRDGAMRYFEGKRGSQGNAD